jgi:hypothetical protein
VLDRDGFQEVDVSLEMFSSEPASQFALGGVRLSGKRSFGMIEPHGSAPHSRD